VRVTLRIGKWHEQVRERGEVNDASDRDIDNRPMMQVRET